MLYSHGIFNIITLHSSSINELLENNNKLLAEYNKLLIENIKLSQNNRALEDKNQELTNNNKELIRKHEEQIKNKNNKIKELEDKNNKIYKYHEYFEYLISEKNKFDEMIKYMNNITINDFRNSNTYGLHVNDIRAGNTIYNNLLNRTFTLIHFIKKENELNTQKLDQQLRDDYYSFMIYNPTTVKNYSLLLDNIFETTYTETGFCHDGSIFQSKIFHSNDMVLKYYSYIHYLRLMYARLKINTIFFIINNDQEIENLQKEELEEKIKSIGKIIRYNNLHNIYSNIEHSGAHYQYKKLLNKSLNDEYTN